MAVVLLLVPSCSGGSRGRNQGELGAAECAGSSLSLLRGVWAALPSGEALGACRG